MTTIPAGDSIARALTHHGIAFGFPIGLGDRAGKWTIEGHPLMDTDQALAYCNGLADKERQFDRMATSMRKADADLNDGDGFTSKGDPHVSTNPNTIGLEGIVECLYDLSPAELRGLALECLMISDGPNAVARTIDAADDPDDLGPVMFSCNTLKRFKEFAIAADDYHTGAFATVVAIGNDPEGNRTMYYPDLMVTERRDTEHFTVTSRTPFGGEVLGATIRNLNERDTTS